LVRSIAKCVAVPTNYAQRVLEELRRHGVYLEKCSAERIGRIVLIPVKDLERALRILNRIPFIESVEYVVKCREHFDLRTLLSRYVPREVVEQIPRSFDIVGDIALIELEDRVAERFGSIIARAIMELQPHVKTVYARGPTVGTERVRVLRFLGGEPKTRTIHREHGIRIVVDVARAYFNPSLATERSLVASEIPRNSIVLDLFTGVGPFALHIARRVETYIVACDINVDALQLLRESLSLNKLKGFVEPLHIDSIEMIKGGFLRDRFDAVIANLPHKAPDLVPWILDVLRRRGRAYVYAVCSDVTEARMLFENLCRRYGCVIETIRRVLDYAPRKIIARATLIKI